MRTILRGLRPSPALVIACLALFMAMGGVGYAALKGKDKMKVRTSPTRKSRNRRPG
jgi:hypothetical protein